MILTSQLSNIFYFEARIMLKLYMMYACKTLCKASTLNSIRLKHGVNGGTFGSLKQFGNRVFKSNFLRG